MAGKTVGVVVTIVIALVVIIAAVVVLLPKAPSAGAMRLSSSAFAEGEIIPITYTADNANISPPLSIEGADNKTVSFALIVDDLDAGGFTHWLIWNIPATVSSIPEGVPSGETVEMLGGARQGTNDFNNTGYDGPAPPSEETHTYRFKLYAIDTMLILSPGAIKA